VFLDGIGLENTNNTIKYLLDAKKSLQYLIFSPTSIDVIHSYRLESIENVCLVENNDQPIIAKPCIHIAHQQNENLPKPRTLLAVIENHKKDAYLITCDNQDECFLLDRFLARYGHEIKSIIDDRAQDISKSIKDLVNKKINILICPSDFLISQDLSNVEHIINYNLFDKASVYEQVTQFNKQANGIHRKIINIVSSRELGFLTSLKSQCNIAFEHQTLPSDEEIINLSAKRIIKFINKQAQDVELGQFIELAEKNINR
jgi:superfamily II DNA/RNA helicase